MDRERVIALLKALGYKPYPPRVHGEWAVWAGEKQLPDGPECVCNRRRPAWHAVVSDSGPPAGFQSLTLEIRAATRLNLGLPGPRAASEPETWWSLEVYGVRWTDLDDLTISKFEERLKRAWEAVQ